MHRSIKGGALPMVVGISLIMISISASLLLAGYYYKIRDIGIEKKEIIQRNLISGINLFLGIKDELKFDEEISIDLFSKKTDSIRLLKKSWGCFELGIISSFSNTASDSIAILLGVKNEGMYKSTLYLVDNRRPLSIAGETKIKGDVFLPSTGVKAAYINRVGFKGKNFIQGKILKSTVVMPGLEYKHVKRVEQLFEDPFVTNPIASKELPDSLFHSFLAENTFHFHEEDSLVIQQVLKGNIILKSNGVIYVKQNAIIQDIILIAPVIHIEEGFIGSGQFICNESIIIEDNTILKYPSCIVVLDNNKPSIIEIGKNAIIDGFIFQFSNGRNSDNKKLHIKENCAFTGIAHIDGFVDLKGTINGHLSCQKFLISLESGVYENHLYNVSMKNDLDEMFISPALFPTKKSGIIRYLK